MSATQIGAAQRTAASYEDAKRYIVGAPQYSSQFCNLYVGRIAKLHGRVLEAAKAKWPSVPVMSKIIDVRVGVDCVISGAVFKVMKDKPNVLDEYTEAMIMAGGREHKSNYASASDSLVLEDESGRVAIRPSDGSTIDPQILCSGIVLAIRGHVAADGDFVATDFCFALPRARGAPKPAPQNGTVLLISSLGISRQPSLQLQLLADYVTGQCGDPLAGKAAAITRVIIIGGCSARQAALQTKDSEADAPSPSSLSKSASDAVSESAHSQTLTDGVQFHAAADHIAADVQGLDNFIAQIARSVPVDFIPGHADPTNFGMPQQPFHPCLMPSCMGFGEAFNAVTNPHEFRLGNVTFLGHDGSPTSDILKFTTIADDMDALESTLRWQHVAPTAPDTLDCYPYVKNDPFVINYSPDVFFCGGAKQFASRKVSISEEHETLLLTIPRFDATGVAVRLDLASGQATEIRFDPGKW
eukprot:g2108.t1